MAATSDFSLRVVEHACSGAPALRERLIANGLDTTTIAKLLRCSPMTLARATRGGATPRGMLVGLAALAALVDALTAHGLTVVDVQDGSVDPDELDGIGQASPLADRLLQSLREHASTRPHPAQLTLKLPGRTAA